MKLIAVIITIFILALGLRFYRIADVPMSLNWDEAAFGYNAYSLLKTGKDEYGQIMPLQFLSIGDYKCPLYIYLLVPVIKIFGLNEWAVRSVPALLGAMTVPLLFVITKKLFKSNQIAALAAISLALSPWHLQFTRAGADVTVSSFFLILGMALALRKDYKLSGLMLGLSLYAYFGERAFTPLVLGMLIWYLKRQSVKIIIVFTVTVLPLLIILFSSGHINKVTNTSLLGYKPDMAQILKEDYQPAVFWAFHNGITEKTKMIVSRYFNHFSPVFLFVQGPEDGRQRIDGMGMLYRSDLILILAFSIWAFNNKFHNKHLSLLLIWLLIGPIPAAITRDAIHARRSFNMVYPLSIFLGIGANYIWSNRRKYLFLGFIWLGVFGWSLSYYLTSYYVFTPRTTYVGSAGWQYGYKQLIAEVSPIKSRYKQIIIDTTYQGPYIFFLFFEKYPPQKYQPQAELIRDQETALGEGRGYDNYVFRPVYWPDDRNLKNSLVAGPVDRIPLKDIHPRESRLVKTIYFPDGTEAWRITETFNE